MPTASFPAVAQTPGQIAAAITTTLNGSNSVQGYREDLATGDLVAAALTSNAGIISYRWELIGRPEGSLAGGAGPEPIFLGNAPTASFTVDDDSGDFPRDGTYILQCTVNFRTPTETRIRAALVRLNAAKLQDGRSLRMLGANESDEDTSQSGVAQGYATMGNRLARLSIELGRGQDAARIGARTAFDAWTGPSPDNVYLAGMRRALRTDVDVAVPAADTMYAVPLFVASSGIIQELMIKQRGGTTGQARLAIYNNLSKGVFPNDLLAESGALAFTGTERQTFTANLRVGPGLYWLVSLYNSAFNSNACQVDHLLADAMAPILGTANDLLDGGGAGLDFGVAWTHAQAFGALPDPFPTSAPAQVKVGAGGVQVPSVFFRWSL